MNISGPAAVAKPEMLFYAPGDLTVTYQRDLRFGVPFSLHGFPAPFQRRFPALIVRVMAGYPMQTVIRFSRFDEGL